MSVTRQSTTIGNDDKSLSAQAYDKRVGNFLQKMTAVAGKIEGRENILRHMTTSPFRVTRGLADARYFAFRLKYVPTWI